MSAYLPGLYHFIQPRSFDGNPIILTNYILKLFIWIMTTFSQAQCTKYLPSYPSHEDPNLGGWDIAAGSSSS